MYVFNPQLRGRFEYGWVSDRRQHTNVREGRIFVSQTDSVELRNCIVVVGQDVAGGSSVVQGLQAKVTAEGLPSTR